MPGIPKKPTISAVTGFIATYMPKDLPRVLRINKTTPPIIPLIMSRIKNFLGTTSSHPNAYSKNNPIKYAITILYSMLIFMKNPPNIHAYYIYT